MDVRVNKSTKAIEELFKIGQGWKNGESFDIILELSEDEVRKLLMLAPYELSDLPQAILQIDRVSLVNGTRTRMAFVATNGIDDATFRSLSATSITEPVVDTIDFAYYVLTPDCLDDRNQSFSAVRIFYN